MTNTFKITLLLSALTIFLLLVGRFVSGRSGSLVAIIVAALMNFVSYCYSERIGVARYRPQRLAPEQLPQLQRTGEKLAQRASSPVPKIYLIANDSPIAFVRCALRQLVPDHPPIAKRIDRLIGRDALGGVGGTYEYQ
jgi:heat shock protein HtpX